MVSKKFEDRIILGATGRTAAQVIKKLKDAEKNNIKKIALFLELINESDKKKVYKFLESSKIKKIPLVHIRNDMKKWELKLLREKFGAKYLTIHEDSFRYLKKWEGHHKFLYLEMNFNNSIAKYVKVNKIAGFCVDLAHFKAAEERWTKEFEYVLSRKNVRRYFKCNHLNGFDYKIRKDVHKIRAMPEFEYLKTLPRFLFGDCIALEIFNNIEQQIKFKEYLVKMLNKRFNNQVNISKNNVQKTKRRFC